MIRRRRDWQRWWLLRLRRKPLRRRSTAGIYRPFTLLPFLPLTLLPPQRGQVLMLRRQRISFNGGPIGHVISAWGFPFPTPLSTTCLTRRGHHERTWTRPLLLLLKLKTISKRCGNTFPSIVSSTTSQHGSRTLRSRLCGIPTVGRHATAQHHLFLQPRGRTRGSGSSFC